MAESRPGDEDGVSRAELEAALEALREPGRFRDAEQLVSAAAPGLHRLLLEAMAAGGWGAEDDLRQVDQALASSDPASTRAALLGLLGEQSRIAMLVGVAVGIELARELELVPEPAELLVSRHGNDSGGKP